MKRFVCLMLTLCLALALCVPALAETEDMEAALQEVTLRVKETLDIDDDYASFSGNRNDGLRPGWYLYWSDDGRDLSVTCDDDGLVTEAYYWRSGGRGSFSGFRAAFPALDETAARAQAEERLARLMGEGETARIDGVTVTLTEEGDYRFTGTVLKNGLDSPVRFQLALNGDGLSSYYRSDSGRGYIGGVPDSRPTASREPAAKLLEEATAFELYYVAEDGEARLRYVPVGPYTVVDALTGQAQDMDALYASFGGSARAMEEPAAMEMSAADAGGGRGLTAVELSSIANYRDVLVREALDQAVRALPGLALDDFALDRCSYAMDAEGNVTAELRYRCQVTEDRLFGFSRAVYDDYITWGDTPQVVKYLTLDAKTGTLLSLGTNYPFWEGDRDIEADLAEDPTEEFLAAAAPDLFPETALCTLRACEGEEGQTYARLHEGYFFPANYLYVRVDPGTGAIDRYTRVWDEDMAFAPAAGIVDEAAARTAYTGALDVTLGYAAWPEAIDWDDPVLYRYADWGYTYVESLRLGYYYRGLEDIAGVDALTGEPVTEKADGSLVYTDLEGVPQRESIEALGSAGIGFAGGFFRPEQTLTRRDAAVLLLQAAGYRVTDWDDETLGREAVWMGFLSADQWQPEETLTQAEFAAMVLGASAYGAAAELTGVWAPAYGDDGLSAMAAALGMTEAGAALSREPCTRAAAAELLYRFMDR